MTPTEPQILLSVRDAAKVFRMGEIEVHALRHATLDILVGEFLVIIGPSGSGKSTLLNLIGGMDRATSGQVLIDGKDLGTFSDYELTQYRKHQVGFVFQFYNLVPTLTALENLEVVTEITREPMDAVEALKLVGLAHRHDHFPSQMSGGEQQRTAIARAIAGNPRLLLCDEPTGALDIKTSQEVLGLLVDLNARLKKTIVVITHNHSLAQVADRVAIIKDGTVVSLEKNTAKRRVEDVEW